jgi:hypothetical protein
MTRCIPYLSESFSGIITTFETDIVSVESLDAVQTRGGPDKTLPFSHCLRWKHDFSSEMADDGKDGIAAPGLFRQFPGPVCQGPGTDDPRVGVGAECVVA